MIFHGFHEPNEVMGLQRLHDCLVLRDAVPQMGPFFLQLEADVHLPDGVHQGIQHRVFQGPEEGEMEIPVQLGEQAFLLIADADPIHNLPQVLDILLLQGVKRVAHVAELQVPAHVKHLPDGAFIAGNLEKEHALEDIFHAEGQKLRPAAGDGPDNSHDLHALDSFPHHVAADAELGGQHLLRRKQIPRLQPAVQNQLMNLAEHLDIQLLIRCHCSPPFLMMPEGAGKCTTNLA